MSSLLLKKDEPQSKVKKLTEEGWKLQDIDYVLDALNDIAEALEKPKKFKHEVSRTQKGFISAIVSTQVE